MPAGCKRLAMLTELYIQALMVDEELADQVWEACGMLTKQAIKLPV